ncbi:MAG: hypothetical protein CBD16_01680 [Betaproteobacteria bacterium TMED156]|nr:MAG: hypothetical protein CBD16_01680 [Betaproteobacteria bacterium TMED156]|tara:strand:- start:292 stop:756 length:465 start_codon:yes stop_codon:yes gene_type:complete
MPILLFSLVAFLTASIGGYLTKLDDWYYSLSQPSWKPPDLAFGPVWTIIFILFAISTANAYKTAKSDINYKKKLLNISLLSCGLNVIWSYFYFFVQRPDLALLEVIFLWSSILILIIHINKYSKLSALLLLPYILWVSLASALNYQTVMLNGPF